MSSFNDHEEEDVNNSHSERRVIKHTCRHRQYRENSKSPSKPRSANSSCCSLFRKNKGRKTLSSEHISDKPSKGAVSAKVFGKHLKSLQRQINDTNKFTSVDKTVYLSPEYVKLKLGKNKRA